MSSERFTGPAHPGRGGIPPEDLWSLLDSFWDTLSLHDRHGRILQISHAVEGMFGRKGEDLVGATLDALLDGSRVPPEEVARVLGRVLEGEPQLVEWWGQRADGGTFPIEVSVVPRMDRDGQGAALALIRDISARRELNEQVRLAQRMEAVGRLAGGVAHDFNNLLTVIRGHSSLLLKALPPGSYEYAEIQAIHRAAERAAGLTHQLLAFSRQQMLHVRSLDLNAVVRQTDRMLRRLIGADIELVTLLDEDLGWTMADSGQLDQVLLNLAMNARDAMPEGGKLSILTRNAELTADDIRRYAYPVEPGKYVALVVSDTGSGMDAATLSHIFEPFFTTKAGRGTGLGLSTVYGIVKQSGGYIWVESSPGEGTTFTIYLRRTESRPRADGSADDDAPRARAGETVMVVEDEEAVRHVTRLILQMGGYRVIEASNGEEAFRFLDENPGVVDLVLTDLVMPLMGGRELVRLLSGLPQAPQVLYMSGYTDAVQIVQTDAKPLDAEFLQKPFTVEELLHRVRNLLDTPVAVV